ncbi:Cation Diffusion Facilitator (CDF) Family [Phytophthora nicotianae]|uniref:Cation Diffusion Facilitator (CDF) Family n=1 Tax=Phytophthora nicotianae TaxID=4792 RepID=A0A0W8DAU1_PHYNI|nr:Cation Diffusion Facilitator (CDF) Family [Phytophthora nicotianae]
MRRATVSPGAKDDDADEPDVEKSQPLNVDAKKIDSLSESSSSSDSSSTDEDDNTVKIKTEVHRKVRKSSISGQDRRDKRSSRSPTSSKSREKKRSLSGGDNSHSASKSRMNDYMEARAKKRNEKLKRKQEKEHEETKKKEEYEKEWEKMAQEERERKRKQQQARRNGRRRPASMKTVRVSQMRQQMNSKQQQKDQKEPQVSSPPHPNDLPRPHGDDSVDMDGQPRRNPRRKSESKTSESEAEEERMASTESPPLPPEPTLADTELYLRQQARLRERHELQMKKKLEADEADAVRGDIHRRVEMWAFGKELLHMILTLDQISSNDALKKCQLVVVQSPDDDTVRKAYRNIIRVVHPDKLRGATVPEQLEAKELFTVLNQAFEKFKNQTS